MSCDLSCELTGSNNNRSCWLQIQEEDREVRESLLALEETEQQLKEQREKAETRRRHLLNETTKVAGIIENVQRTTGRRTCFVVCGIMKSKNNQRKYYYFR